MHYRLQSEGGSYKLWMLTKFDYIEESGFRIGLDGNVLQTEELYNHGSMFRYESEQIYQWVLAARLVVKEGEHVLDVYSMASGMRYDRFYLTKGEELPPGDEQWLSITFFNFNDRGGLSRPLDVCLQAETAAQIAINLPQNIKILPFLLLCIHQ